MTSRHEAVIGLEVHVQLRTAQKIFCADSTEFGAPPNTQVCPVCLGLPGALPVLNQEAVDLAVRAALALECRVHDRSVFARKNYFYPDLPKGYQISQFDRPLATGGRLPFETEEGPAQVRIRRIHLEEDAGKSLHDRFDGATAVDLNRAGTPLAEIVSEPDLRSPEQVRGCLQALKQLLEYLDVSDCSMEEGSLRVDANVSVRPAGAEALGTKTELKNLNSFSGVEKALTLEIERQVAIVEAGGAVVHQTLLWDAARGEVRPMRSKEESHDYRYFPDPDLPILVIPPERVRRIAAELPERPAERRARFQHDYGLPAYDAGVLTARRALADYYESLVRAVGDAKAASNWLMGPVLREANERRLDLDRFPIAPEGLAELVALVEDGTISRAAGRKVLAAMLDSGRSARSVVTQEGLTQVRDRDLLDAWIEEVLSGHADEVARYRAGEERLLGWFVGQVLRRSGGKADPKEVGVLLRSRLG